MISLANNGHGFFDSENETIPWPACVSLLSCKNHARVELALACTGTLWEWLDKRTINMIAGCTRFAEFVSPFTNMFVKSDKDGFMVLMFLLQV